MADDMDLRMRILARGEQALATFRALEHRINGMIAGMARVGVAGRVAFSFVGRATSLAFAPLRFAAGVLGGVGLGLAGLGTAAISAAADMETLRMRLEGVVGSAETAGRLFAETERMSIPTPFTPEQMVEARIGLLNLGLASKESLATIADTAAITQKDMKDLVSVIASLETEPLRRMGVMVKRAGDAFEFTFRDKAQVIRKVTAKTFGEAQQALFGIFDVKYGGGAAGFASKWKGLTSTFTGMMKIALGQIGKGLLPRAKDFLSGVNTRLGDLLDRADKPLQALGQSVSDKLMAAWDYGRAVVERASQVLDALRDEPGKGAEVLRFSLVSGAEILAISLANYLRGMGTVFASIGRMIGASFVTVMWERLSKLPFIGPDAGILAGISAGSAQAQFETGVKGFTERLPALAEETAGAIANILARYEKQVSGAAGIPAGPTVDELTRKYAAERAAVVDPSAMRDIVVARRTVRSNLGSVAQRRVFQAPAGQYKLGQAFPSGGVVIQIESLEVKASNVRALQNALLRAAGIPLVPAAGS